MKKLSILLAIAALVACCGKKHVARVPSPEFTAYVSAYTGGVISTSGTIRIEFIHSRPDVETGAAVGDKLFSFSPSVKGEAYWAADNVIEFVPKDGALKPGTQYDVDFKLGKVEAVDKGLEVFRFSFRTREQDFEVSVDPGVITRSNPMAVTQNGEIRFGDVADAKDVVKMLSLDGAPVSSLEPAEGKSTSFRFSFAGLQRPTDKDGTLELRVKGKPAGIDRVEKLDVVVPAAGQFRFLDARPLGTSEEGIYLWFSEPLDASQDLRGLVEIRGVDDYVFQIEENIVKVLFQSPRDKDGIRVEVARGVRSDSGARLEQSSSLNLYMEAAKPAVEIISQGNIMPDSKELLLTFRTVSLRAVDVRIIRIFESNVLMFLQTNNLDGSNELRRSGRMVYDKRLDLPLGNNGGWSDYSLDLAPLIKQEPGAVYRVELAMRLEYSTYHSGGQPKTTDGAQGMVALRAQDFDPNEDPVWDNPQAYYWSGEEDFDYGKYNWRERDDPYKPSYYMNSERRASTNVLASNLGVIAKSGDGRKIWFAVSDIVTARPVEGASAKIYNYQLQLIGEGKTGSDGMAQIDARGKAFAAVVEKDGARNYVKLTDNEQNSLSRFDVGGKQIQKGLKGYIYGERGVWRPGDTLYLTAVVEDRLRKIPDGHPVTLELFNARGQFHTRQVNARGTGGFWCFTVPTSESDPTGTWNAYVKVGGAAFHKSLRVEAIKPNRLKIKLTLAGDKIDGSARSTPASLDVSWLTGATARSLKASVEMSLVRGSASPFKGYERYTFNNPASQFTSETTQAWSGKTDEDGKAQLSLQTPSQEDAPGVMRADVVCRVFEPGGDASIYVESFPYSPFSRYVGVNLGAKQDEWLETDKDNVFDVVTLNAAGNAVDSRLEYKIYKLNWSWWWERGNESLASWVNGNYASPVEQGTLNTVMGKGRITFRVEYPNWGRYLIYVKDPSGGHASGGIVYVDWPSWRGRSAKGDPDGASMLTFSTDKKSYDVGETATVIIPEAAGARALVSFENGSAVLGSAWVEMASSGDTKYTFKVTEQMAPNFYIHISLLQPHARTAGSLPIRLYGVQPVEVDNKASKLKPVITAPDVLRPQTEFTVKVSEQTGREMTYTLAVVDEGLLDLTNFKTPDPWKEFYAREALGVKTWDIYDYVMGSFGGRMGALLSIGGDEDARPGGRKANRFRPVVKFLGPFTLKKGSTASHKITLPMYIGSVRVMVVAGGGAAYGKADKAIPVRTPLMLLSSLPRVISTGEDITLPVNVFAMEGDVGNVTVKAEITGNASLTGGGQQYLKFDRPGDRMAYFRIKAADLPGTAKIKVSASCGAHKASETIEIAVRNPNPVIVKVVDTLLNAGNTVTIPYDFSGTVDSDNWVRLEVARIPPVDLARRYDFLSDYQHLCSEQLTSRGLPMLYLAQFRDVDKAEAEKIKNDIGQIIKLLYGRQLSNGAFASWPGQAEANDWITSYAGQFLLEAQQRGYEVTQGVINRWKEYQRRTALSWSMPRDRDRQYYYSYQPDVVQAYRLYTLAMSGAAEVGAMNRMKEMPGISVTAKWRLAGAYALAGKQAAAKEVIADIKNTREKYDYASGCGYTYGSPERDAAIVLDALVLTGQMQEALKQARELSRMLSTESYLSTQSTAFALVAMSSFASKLEAGEVDCAWEAAGREGVARTVRAVNRVELPASGPGEVKVASRSKGDLFVSLTTRTRPLVDTAPATANGLALSVAYVDMNGGAISAGSLAQGADFKAVVTVTNTSGAYDYTDLALTHIFPSGWEIFNERMAVSDAALEGGEDQPKPAASRHSGNRRPLFTYQDIRDDRVLTYFELRRGESKTFTVRLQAAYAGHFVMPAVMCEAMYDPVVRARTAAGWTSVK